MPNCKYCGQPAGIFRTRHHECEKRWQRVRNLIPEFVAKCVISTIPIERFGQLIRDIADANYISETQLRNLVSFSLKSFLKRTLEKQLPDNDQHQRAGEIVQELGIFQDTELLGLLLKSHALLDLQANNVPAIVRVAKDFPIKLSKKEHIVWIFNHVCLIKKHKLANARRHKPEDFVYVPYNRTSKLQRRFRWIHRTRGDLLLTDYYIYLILENHIPLGIPISHLTEIAIDEDTITLVTNQGKVNALTILLDDPWFAVNMVLGLSAIKARRDGVVSLKLQNSTE
jgi:hypothetical protein